MKRKIIEINEELCNGCGACTKVCAEAALEMVDGKAKVVGDFLCDGMGACLDVCPVDALKIIEREVEAYDPKRTYEHVKKLRGEAAARQATTPSVEAPSPHSPKENMMHDHSHSHGPGMDGGCPGSALHDFDADDTAPPAPSRAPEKSALRQWPLQLHLLPPQAPYFQEADLLVAADCVPFAYPDFHRKFLAGKRVVIFCPKLDEGQDAYQEKLEEIFATQNIKSVTVARMEVPCCGGVTQLVQAALAKAGRPIPLREQIISIKGELV